MSGQPVVSSFPDLNIAYPLEITMSYQENSFFIRQKDILNYAGQPVGRLMVALDQKPFLDHRKQILINRLLPFFTSVGISILLFFLLKFRVFDKINQLIQVQRLVAEGKGDLSIRLIIPPEKTVTARLDEVERMGMDFNLMMDKLEQTHKQLSLALTEVRAANNHIIGSLEYAKRIQNSMLPNPDEVRRLVPDSFVIWMPRDIVSGDIFFIETVSEGFAAAVIDCTGHGVPGAFLTMIASSALRRIIRDEECSDPALVLKRLNSIMKATLHQDTAYAVSDDGLDAALCMVNTGQKILTFAGAKLPLFYSEKGKINVIKGDKQSIGYKQSKRSDIRFDFSNHTIRIREGMSFYMASDGFEDQLGQSPLGLKRLGSRRFAAMLGEVGNLSFEARRERLIEMFELHKGDTQRQDDVTVIGIGF
jgi:serine phosphatase RsbU (regulator of sigma subunit)